jgi:hypothetical protein
MISAGVVAGTSNGSGSALFCFLAGGGLAEVRGDRRLARLVCVGTVGAAGGAKTSCSVACPPCMDSGDTSSNTVLVNTAGVASSCSSTVAATSSRASSPTDASLTAMILRIWVQKSTRSRSWVSATESPDPSSRRARSRWSLSWRLVRPWCSS